jgi:hypothetical protein
VQEQAAGLTEQQSENMKLLDKVKEAEVSLHFGPTMTPNIEAINSD